MTNTVYLNRIRYRKVVWFFAKVFIHVIWWELCLRKIPFIREHAKASAMSRWRRIAWRFRGLALEMGGVLIKLGQFLSIRVDILPPEVVRELADLQDEVPAEDIKAVIALIEAEFGRSLAQIFPEFEHLPLAAASLAQTHRAVLPNGEKVVVKVQRPGIDVLVHTDLAAIALALRWLKFYPRISQRVNLDWLAEELTRVTSNELDFQAEGENAERFTRDFQEDPALYFPKIYWDSSTPRILTMENVGYIRIADVAGIDAAGISRPALAKKLNQFFLQQIFDTHFVHADPHPGNLFVRALPRPVDLATDAATPFQIILIDFGMMADVPDRLHSALRAYAIGIGTRDAHRVVQSYVEANALLPGADLKRLEEAHQAIFDRFWGVGMSQMRDMALHNADFFLEEYRDLIYETPLQVPVDLLFALRGVGLLSGISISLDPDFDPWRELLPFAQKLAQEQLQQSWPDLVQQLLNTARIIATAPDKLDQVLTKAQRGTLTIENALAPDARRSIHNLEKAIHRLTWAILTIGLLLAGTLLHQDEAIDYLDTTFLAAAAILFIFKVWRYRE